MLGQALVFGVVSFQLRRQAEKFPVMRELVMRGVVELAWAVALALRIDGLDRLQFLIAHPGCASLTQATF
jgi:hypothetical protein